jgi:proline dehydrogenase
MLVRSLILKTSSRKSVERMVRHWRMFQPLVKRFIAGDTLAEALQASKALLDKGFFVTLDYLGENTSTEAEAFAAKKTFIEMLEAIAKAVPNPIPTAPVSAGVSANRGSGIADLGSEIFRPELLNISIKLTQCGLDLGNEVAEKNLREVVWAAAEKHNFVRVDMEASAYTERTLKIVERVWIDMKNMGTVLQSYLRRTDKDVDHVIDLGMRVRLVKGAYLEPAVVAFPDKKHVDEAYVSEAKKLIARGNYPAIATHDESIIDALVTYVKNEEIDKSRFEFQMLYGIRRDLQDRLLKEGYNVRIYVPFGDQWYPYFTRRLAERPANAFFILKSLFKG